MVEAVFWSKSCSGSFEGGSKSFGNGSTFLAVASDQIFDDGGETVPEIADIMLKIESLCIESSE